MVVALREVKLEPSSKPAKKLKKGKAATAQADLFGKEAQDSPNAVPAPFRPLTTIGADRRLH